MELSLTDSLLCPRINQSRGLHGETRFWHLCLLVIFDAMLSTLILKGKLLYRLDWEDCLTILLSHGGWMWPLGSSLRNSAVHHLCKLGAMCKGLGCRVPSDLETSLLDTTVGSPVCYLGDQVLSSFETWEFLWLKNIRIIVSAPPSIPTLFY